MVVGVVRSACRVDLSHLYSGALQSIWAVTKYMGQKEIYYMYQKYNGYKVYNYKVYGPFVIYYKDQKYNGYI
jgi:hypothetical protein